MARQSKISNDTKDLLYKNPRVINFILRFFETRWGKKCRTRVVLGWKPYYYLDRIDAIRLFNSQEEIKSFNKRANLTDLNIDNVVHNLYYGDILFHLEYIFSNDIETDRIIYGEGHERQIENHIIGITPVLDIDSPNVIREDGTIDTKHRVDFFTVGDIFNKYIDIVGKEFISMGIDYRQTFSGNGIHIIGEAYYPEEHGHDRKKVFEYQSKFVTLIKNINYKFKSIDIENVDKRTKIIADKRSKAWNRFYKIPFSFHSSGKRISIPLNKGPIDLEWLKRVTNLDNIKKDSSIIDEVLKYTEDEWSKKIW